MRKIRAQLVISLDGVVDGLEDWRFSYFNDEMGAAMDTTLTTSDTGDVMALLCNDFV